MKIAMLTFYTDTIKKYAFLGEKNKKEYAKIYGYDCIVGKKVLDANRAAAWTKILMIKHYLCKYDWVFWTDADSLVMNMNIDLESIIGKYRNKLMILTRGVSSPINSGQWLIKNTKWSYKLLNKIWNKTPIYFIKNKPWEQGSFVSLLNADIKSKIAIIDYRVMNSIPNIKYIDLNSSPRLNISRAKRIEYRKGDFIVHFMFSKNFNKRLLGMKYYFNKVIAKKYE